MRDDPVVIDLVQRARKGDSAAWNAIVDRYAALVYSVCRGYGLHGGDADDVGGSVWLRLVERLDTLKEPAALPGWLSVTTQRECLQLLRARKRQIPVDDPQLGEKVIDDTDNGLLATERRQALRIAFAELPDDCRRLLSMLFADPPATYAQISADLGLPVGGIGPNRGRCLNRLRRTPALSGFEPS